MDNSITCSTCINLIENENLIVKPSLIDGGGLGLFAKKDFKKNEKVVKYVGIILKKEEENNDSCYKYAPNDNITLDGIDILPHADCAGRYMNSALHTNYKNNVRWSNTVHELESEYMLQDKKYFYVWIYASKNIKAGEEIFIPYGVGFWRRFGTCKNRNEK